MPVEQYADHIEEGVVRTSANVYFEMGIIKTDLHNLRDDVRDLRNSQKEFMEFMYKIQGGKAWFLSMMLIASSLGATLVSITNYLFRAHQ